MKDMQNKSKAVSKTKEEAKREKLKKKLLAYIEKKQKSIKKQEEKRKAALKRERELAKQAKKQSAGGGYVLASTNSSPDELKKYVKEKMSKMRFHSTAEMIEHYEAQTGKYGPAVYGQWMNRQYLFSLEKNDIKKPKKLFVIGLAVAFNLKGEEFKEFVERFGYAFPISEHDCVVDFFLNHGDYDRRIIDPKNQDSAHVKMREKQTMRHLMELDELLHLAKMDDEMFVGL